MPFLPLVHSGVVCALARSCHRVLPQRRAYPIGTIIQLFISTAFADWILIKLYQDIHLKATHYSWIFSCFVNGYVEFSFAL